jgi:hypothetical protein
MTYFLLLKTNINSGTPPPKLMVDPTPLPTLKKFLDPPLESYGDGVIKITFSSFIKQPFSIST